VALGDADAPLCTKESVPRSGWPAGAKARDTEKEIPMKKALFSLMLAPVLLASPALADRAPTPEERTAIEAKLQAEGFTRWESIELEDDESVWEVDDAIAADGKEYDLELRFGTLEIVDRDRD